ncbi:hypothetical protein DPSP01_008660 [Paraphaeosphaeria sporulosa]
MTNPSIVPYYGNTVLRFDSTQGWYPTHLGFTAQATADPNNTPVAPKNPFHSVTQSLVTHSRDLVALEWDNVRREAMAITKGVLERERVQRAEHAARARAFDRWINVRDEKQN